MSVEDPSLWQILRVDLQRVGVVSLAAAVALGLIAINILWLPLVDSPEHPNMILAMQNLLSQRSFSYAIGLGIVGVVALGGESFLSKFVPNREFWLIGYIGKMMMLVLIFGGSIGVAFMGITLASIYDSPLFIIYYLLLTMLPVTTIFGYIVFNKLELYCREMLPKDNPP